MASYCRQITFREFWKKNLKQNSTFDSFYVVRGRGKVIDHFETISSLINILPRVLLMKSMFTRKIFVYTVSSIVKIIAKDICL